MARPLALIITLLSLTAAAQQSTVGLDIYKTNKKFAYAEASYTIGKHNYTVVNIKPLQPAGDTACIGAIVIDKRKYLMFDIGTAGTPTGLVVPKDQPVENSLIILKPSAYEAKTFVALPNGKMVTLPGENVFVDPMGNSIYTVWENDGQYRLTVFDYRGMRMVIQPTLIKKPLKWGQTDVSFYFTVEGEKGYYVVDTFMKAVTRAENPDDVLRPVGYLVDFGAYDRAKCCGAGALGK